MTITNQHRYNAGEKYGLLTLIERDTGTGRWFAECECGERRRVLPSKLRHGKTRTCGVKGRHFRVEIPTYRTVHTRPARNQGKASERECSHCPDQALHWAYDGLDAGALFSDSGLAYSTDLDRYIPLCKFCHVRFDGNQWTPGERPRKEKTK